MMAIYEWARLQPNKTAFIDNGHLVSYSDFARAVTSVRIFFNQQNCSIGHTAIIVSKSLGSTWVLVLAIRAAGLNTIVVQSAAQVEALSIKNAVCLVVLEGEQDDLQLNVNPLKLGVIIVPRRIFRDRESIQNPDSGAHLSPIGGHIIYTSGTTGSYKKLLLTNDEESARNNARARAYTLDGSKVYHSSNFGIWTTLGFRMPAAVWQVGGCVVFENRSRPFSRFFRNAVDIAVLTAPMLKELIDSMGDNARQDRCEISIAAGFLPTSLARDAYRLVTKRIGIGFGSSELATPAMLSRPPNFSYWLAPLAGRTVQVVDENGRECPPGREGELRVLLDDIDCRSYMEDPESTARVFRDGYFHPGDMAVKRSDGRIRIVGRTSDVLNVQGVKVAVAPIELKLQRLLAVDEVCLFSRLNESGKDELLIAIQSKGDVAESALEAIARMFPKFERVRFAVLPEFPRTVTGTQKTQRTSLRNIFS